MVALSIFSGDLILSSTSRNMSSFYIRTHMEQSERRISEKGTDGVSSMRKIGSRMLTFMSPQRATVESTTRSSGRVMLRFKATALQAEAKQAATWKGRGR